MILESFWTSKVYIRQNMWARKAILPSYENLSKDDVPIFPQNGQNFDRKIVITFEPLKTIEKFKMFQNLLSKGYLMEKHLNQLK